MIRINVAHLATGLLAVVATMAMLTASALPLSIPGIAYQGPFDETPVARLKLGTMATKRAIELAPVTSGERAAREEKAQLIDDAVPRRPLPMQIGIGRDIPASAGTFDFAALPWQSTPDGGLAAQISVRSPAAEALRAELRYSGAADGMTFTFAGSAPYSETFGPFGWSQMETMSRWSPVVDGDTMTIEIALAPGMSPAGRALSVPQLAHHDISLNPRSPGALKATGIGTSGKCNIDIACVANQSPAASTTAAASALITFVANGRALICSGQLINSTDAQGTPTQIPYFITANHCVNNASAAGTVQFMWFFQAATCGGASAPTQRTTTGGAALLYTTQDVDVTLIRPNTSPPAGVFLAGWDATPPMPGTSIFAIHHPNGDLTKYSAGTLNGYGKFCDFTNAAGTVCTVSQGSYIRVNWTQGTTEGGSSGSGVYTVDQAGAYRLRGVLHGGGAACETPNDPDFFSRFDLAYPGISQFVAGVTQPVAGANAIEYYNVDLDHYFLTGSASETTSIENGSAGAGWVRTGYAFPVGAGLTPGQVPVCRFYGPGPNSHFYTADAAECAQVKKDPGWLYESNAFNINLPSAQTCPANTIPIFRTYNNGFASNNSNHRYTTSPYIYQWMQTQPSVVAIFLGRSESAARWSGEATVMCAPLAG